MNTPALDSRQLAHEDFLRREAERARMFRDETARRIGMCRDEWLLSQIVEPPVVFREIAEAI